MKRILLLFVVLLTPCVSYASSYDLYDNSNQYSGLITTRDGSNYTIENQYGQDVGSFSIPQEQPYQPPQYMPEVQSRTPTEDDPRTLVLPPVKAF